MNMMMVNLVAFFILLRTSSSVKPLGSYLGIEISGEVRELEGSYAKPDSADTKKLGSSIFMIILSLYPP
jgi:hypothetical protein